MVIEGNVDDDGKLKKKTIEEDKSVENWRYKEENKMIKRKTKKI